MDVNTLKKTLAVFVDRPGSLALERGRLLVQIGEEMIDAEISVRDGQVKVREAGVEDSAESWIARRIANLGLLAERVSEACALDHPFVRPKGEFLDQIDRMPNERTEIALDALDIVKTFLDRRPAGTCSVLYLTSDAGEGKTTLIKRLAYDQAIAFRRRDVDWLLVPINLGGKPFLRFDDVIAAALLNNFRFRRIYYEGFIQLVRMGFVVPALDGFEEIFVETDEGGAVSSLGTLIRNMGGEGSLLIAARRAYFEFKSLQSQAKLLDALPETDVSFGRLRIERWGREEFEDFCRSSGVREPEVVYRDVAARIGEKHPLLTRPVFVKRLVDIVNSASREVFLSELRPETEDYFSPFIDRILEREINEKWIDKYGEPPQPLLNLLDHYELLGLIAEEMWLSKTGSISSEMCASLAELFCEARHLSPTVTRQVRERLQTHALLVSTGPLNSLVAFDHEHFREFFLGKQLGSYLAQGATADLRKLLRADLIPNWALDTAVSVALRERSHLPKLIQLVVATAKSESPLSFVRENSGALCLRLLDGRDHAHVVIENMSFPNNSLEGRNVARVEFRDCYFRPSVLDSQTFSEIRFVRCEFERLTLPRSLKLSGVEMVESVVHSLTLQDDDATSDVYDPERVGSHLSSIGVSMGRGEAQQLEIPEITRADPELEIVKKLLHIFMRSTRVSEHVLTLRLGVHAHLFFSEIEEALVSSGILQPVEQGAQGKRYRLGIPLRAVSEALASANGSYAKFLARLKTAQM